MHHPIDRITHTTAFVTPVVEHWLERDIVECSYHRATSRSSRCKDADCLLSLPPTIMQTIVTLMSFVYLIMGTSMGVKTTLRKGKSASREANRGPKPMGPP